jgi:hypothetical protein
VLSRAFWQTLWVAFISLIATLGIGLAIVAGATLAQGNIAGTITAVLLAGACGVLCVLADETRRETNSWP